MHKLYQTIDDRDLKANTNHAFAMVEQGPVVTKPSDAQGRVGGSKRME